MSYNHNNNWVVNKNLTVVKELGINNIISVIKEVLIGEKGKKVVEWKTWTCTIYLPHRLGN